MRFSTERTIFLIHTPSRSARRGLEDPVSYTHLDVYKRQVYSHPQALMQCSDFFDEHKDINQVAVRNTAFSAKKVKDDGDITQAGICLLYTSRCV